MEYIEATSEASVQSSERLPPMPLLKVARSVPVWALQYSLVGFYWVIYTIVTLSPLFYDTVYDLPVDLVRRDCLKNIHVNSCHQCHNNFFDTLFTDWIPLWNPIRSIHRGQHPCQSHSSETCEPGHCVRPISKEVLYRIWLPWIRFVSLNEGSCNI